MLAQKFAARVAEVLDGCVEFHLVGRTPDSVTFGIGASDRPTALGALGGLTNERGWRLAWEGHGREHTISLPATRTDRILCSPTWYVYREFAFGDQAVGREVAVEITFWELGASGQMERIGVRGQERFDPRSPRTIEVIDGHEYPGLEAFPVGANLEHFGEPIDVVYTWVDGSDPAWLESFRATAAASGRSIDETALDPARYRSRDELRYSLRSVWAFAGWVNRIYIVTAGQRPQWMLDDEQITFVDHSEIMPADALPTFNSHSIEASLHKIPGLSEHFIYFNDDMLLGRPVRPETFFTSNGLAKVFQSDARVVGYEDENTLAVDTAARRGRELLQQRFGRVVSHKPLHSPYPLRRSAIEQLESEFREIMDATVHSRFRSPTDLSVAASLAQHYALGIGVGVLGEIDSEYVHVESGRLRWHLDRIRLSRRFDTFCINETEHAGGSSTREAQIRAFFEEYFPVPAPWERDGA